MRICRYGDAESGRGGWKEFQQQEIRAGLYYFMSPMGEPGFVRCLNNTYIYSDAVHSECSFGGRAKVCITTQYCSVFSRKLRICSGVAVGAATSK